MPLPMSVLASAIGQVLGLPLSPTHASMGGASAPTWTPTQWFLANEQGIWLDPSDFTRYMADKGPELSQDLSFDDTSKWNKGGGWSVSGGQAVHNGSVAEYINSLFNAIPGKVYEYVIDIAAIPAGSNVIVYCNGVAGPAYTAAGVYTTAIFCPVVGIGLIKHSIRASNSTGGTTRINSFSIKEVTSATTATLFEDSLGYAVVTRPEQLIGMALDKRLGLVPGANVVVNGDFSSGTGWTLGDSWVISGGVLTATAVGGGTTASRIGDVVAGKWYKATVVINSITGGVKISIGGADSTTITGAGTYCFILLATNTNISLQAQGTSTFVIDSIAAQELPGNHATQATAGKKPVLSARKNLLTRSEDLSVAPWSFSNATVTPANGANASGAMTLSKVQATTTAAAIIWQSVTAAGSATGNTLRFLARKGSGATDCNSFGVYNVTSTTLLSLFNLNYDTGAITHSVGSGATATSLGNNLWEVKITHTTGITAGNTLQFYGGFVGNAETAGEYAYVGEFQLEASPTATTYQRVNTATDYDSVGFPLYLKFDGVDDFLSTGNIDFTATDKMTVLAGARKLASAEGVIAELSAQYNLNNGSFNLQSRADPNGVSLFVRGSASTSAVSASAFTTNTPAVVTATSKIAADWLHAISVNAGAPAIASTNVGTDNFGNYPLYIGRRGGTSSPFNGNLYQLVVRGALTADLTPGETFTAGKTGITL